MEQIGNKLQNNRYTIRRETYDGKPHIVVPVVMMLEGVHSGSDGPVLHLAEELSHMVAAWNGIPVVVQHPQNEQGLYISANGPSVPYVGRVFNTRFEDNKLKAEAWINVPQITSISPTALGYITQQRPLDVSVGVFTDTEQTASEWNGVAYTGIARNYRPDHLALLPGETGACSWNDGCGIRTNKQNKNPMNKEKEASLVLNSLQNRKNEYTTLVDKVRRLLDSMDSEQTYHYAHEIYDDGVIYSTRNRQTGAEVFYQQNYTVNEAGEVVLADDRTKVIRKTEFVLQNNSEQKNNKKEKETPKMENNKKTPCFQGKVEALIANERTRFNEEDRDFLMGLSETQLDKLEPKMARTAEKTDKPVEVNAETVSAFLSAQPEAELIKLLPSEMQANVNAMLTERKERRATMVTEILAVNKDFSEPELTAMSCEMLKKVHNIAVNAGTEEKDETDFSAQGVQANKATPGKGTSEAPLMTVGE